MKIGQYFAIFVAYVFGQLLVSEPLDNCFSAFGFCSSLRSVRGTDCGYRDDGEASFDLVFQIGRPTDSASNLSIKQSGKRLVTKAPCWVNENEDGREKENKQRKRKVSRQGRQTGGQRIPNPLIPQKERFDDRKMQG